MVIAVMTLIVAIVALVLLWLAGRLLIDMRWLIGWLKGSLGLLLLSGCIGTLMVGWDLWHYHALQNETVVATVSFTETAPQQYEMTLTGGKSTKLTVPVQGDLWRAEFAVVSVVPDMASGLPAEPIYRLQAIQSRYLTLEQEQELGSQRVTLHKPYWGIDSWPVLQWFNDHASALQAQEKLTSYMPMVDGVIFNVLLSADGARAEPVNEAAKTITEKLN